PSRSPLAEALQSHWRTTLHLVALVAGLAVGFYTAFVYAAPWLAQVAQVPARTVLGINTLAMALSLAASLAAGALSDRIGRRPGLIAWGASLALLAYPLMSLMATGKTGSIIAGQVGLALLVAAGSGALPATMAELAPWARARHQGRAGAVAGALHGGVGGAQPGDGAARRDHAAHRGVARLEDGRAPRA